jgi:hypothetical protein
MRITFFAALSASLVLLVSATVWEGVSAVVSKGDLPGNYSVATNSFPKNTVVEITNLENGKMVRALVVSGLDASGFLATLSRKAADAIDLRRDYTCRIRMTRPSDEFAFSHLPLGPIVAEAPSAPESEPVNNTSVNLEPLAELNSADDITAAEKVTDNGTVQNKKNEPADKPVNVIAAHEARNQTNNDSVAAVGKPANQADESVSTINDDTDKAADDLIAAEMPELPTEEFPEASTDKIAEAVPMETDKISTVEDPSSAESGLALPDKLSLVPSRERIPEDPNRVVIAPEDMLPPARSESAPLSRAPETGHADFSPFRVPLISQLENGKWYVQVAAYARPDHVEDEITRIGTMYPMAIQNVGSDASPMFRVLLGPLNQGESGAMLQRLKSIGYADAFIRNN